MIRFSDDLRSRFPAKAAHMDDYETFLPGYESRLWSRMVAPDSRPRRVFGMQGAHLLLTSVARARLLTATFVHCANGCLAPGMYLATRAHFEMTGIVAHLLATLRRFYSSGMNEDEMKEAMERLGVGRRWHPPEFDAQDRIEAVNALTLIGSAAKMLDDKDIETFVRDVYDFLSEQCHPNMFGRLTGIEVSDDLFVLKLDKKVSMDQDDLGVCLSHGVVSQALFFHAFDQALALLRQHEEMPRLEQ